jgi:HK97 family phage prohead protease
MSVIENPVAGGNGTDQIRYAVAPIRDVDFRDASANHDGSWTISGYAAVFDQETVLYDDQFGQVRESIAPDAFDGVLAREHLVHLNLGHDMNRSVASTDVPAGNIGSLELSSDSHGLRFLARVDRNDPDAQALAAKMSRGIIRQASFAFNIESRSSENVGVTDDGRTITKVRIETVRNLFDVCCTPQAAYPQTEAMLRSIGASFGQPAEREAIRVTPPLEDGSSVVIDGDAGTTDPAIRKRLALLRVKAASLIPNEGAADS